MALVWASLALAIVLPTIGVVVVFRRAVDLWRDAKRGLKALGDGVEKLSRRLEATSAAADALGASPSRVAPAVARLEVSLAELGVLRSALRDVRESATRVTAVYPRK